MQEPKYKRVLLKISGEALAGEKHFGLDFNVMGQVADVIRECVSMGVQVGVVVGGRAFGVVGILCAYEYSRGLEKINVYCAAWVMYVYISSMKTD